MVPTVELAGIITQDDLPFADIDFSSLDQVVLAQAWPIQLPASLETGLQYSNCGWIDTPPAQTARRRMG